MNVEIKEEQKVDPVILDEIYRAGSPEPLYRPNVHHEIFQMDQWTKNIIPNVEYPYPTNHNYNFAVPITIAAQMEKLIPPSPNGFNPFSDPDIYLPKPIAQITINEVNGGEPLKKPRGRPKKNPLANDLTEIKDKQSIRRTYTKKNKPIAGEPDTPQLIAPKRPVGRPRMNRKTETLEQKNDREEHQQQTEEESFTVTSMIVPPEQEFKAISHEFEPIVGGEEPIQIVKMPTEKVVFPVGQKLRLAWFLF